MYQTKKINPKNMYDLVRRTRPQTKQDLQNYIKVFLGIDIPNKQICPNHDVPLDYLWHTFNTDFETCHCDQTDKSMRQSQSAHVISTGAKRSGEIHLNRPLDCARGDKQRNTQYAQRGTTNGDCIVWANRAGGKTELAAIATLLDCVFKVNCQIRILAGSGEQSLRMYEYFLNFLKKGFDNYLESPPLKEKCRFKNGSAVEVLNQSATSIRGQHIHKLRCDEIELFTDEVLNAAKFTTQTKDGILAAMELISTMHRPYGQMQKLITDAQKNNTPIFKWCVFETIEKCTDRTCSQCPLWNHCRAKAKNANGYLKIDDVITQMKRSSRAGFESEMLCLRPSLENAVFSDFDPDIHVKDIEYNPNLPLFRAIDFGFINPFVCLWIQTDPDGTVRVIDEYIKSRSIIEIHAKEIMKRTPCPELNVAVTFCDPAGAASNDVTGTSAIRELRQMGIKLRYRKSSILPGIELIRRAIKDGSDNSKLIISPKCEKLIEALRCYHYPEQSNYPTELPLKDGIHDHPIDALRYFFINNTKNGKTIMRNY